MCPKADILITFRAYSEGLQFFPKYFIGILGLNRSYYFTFFEDDDFCSAAGDSYVGMLSFARTVHHAAHDGNGNVLFKRQQLILPAVYKSMHIESHTAASRAAYDGNTAAPFAALMEYFAPCNH